MRWFGLLLSSSAFAVPLQTHHQGRIIQPSGQPYEGAIDLEFRLYLQAEGGSWEWNELHQDVPVSGGYYSALLGSVAGLDTSVFDAPAVWLEVKAGDDVLTPRTRLSSVPFALRTEGVGLTSGDPAASSCDDPSEYGHTRFDPTAYASGLYLCSAAGWARLDVGTGSIVGSGTTADPYTFVGGAYAESCKAYLDHPGYRDEGSAVYTIDPTWTTPHDVWCDMETLGGGWTKMDFVRNISGNVSIESPTDVTSSDPYDYQARSTAIGNGYWYDTNTLPVAGEYLFKAKAIQNAGGSSPHFMFDIAPDNTPPNYHNNGVNYYATLHPTYASEQTVHYDFTTDTYTRYATVGMTVQNTQPATDSATQTYYFWAPTWSDNSTPWVARFSGWYR